MNYAASVADFFKSPKWMMNMLLGGLCILLPIVGPMVVLGWLVTGFWARSDENFATFPAFDFSYFDKYLERGLWPFLVFLITSLLIVPVLWMFMAVAMIVSAVFAGNDAGALNCSVAIAMFLLVAVLSASMFGLMLVTAPLMIRATLTQDFAKAFDFGFAKRFLALTWKEVVGSFLFVVVTGALFFCLGMMAFCVGMYFATVLSYFSGTHLHKQLYALYLSRGGEPVSANPKLSGGPPAIPAT